MASETSVLPPPSFISVVGDQPSQEPSEWKQILRDNADLIRTVSQAVGRIEWGDGRNFVGTGWMLRILTDKGDKVFIVTCAHVAKDLVSSCADGSTNPHNIALIGDVKTGKSTLGKKNKRQWCAFP